MRRTPRGRRIPAWSVISILGGVGALLLLISRGTPAWIGLAMLVVAVVLGFFDGYRGWSEGELRIEDRQH